MIRAFKGKAIANITWVVLEGRAHLYLWSSGEHRRTSATGSKSRAAVTNTELVRVMAQHESAVVVTLMFASSIVFQHVLYISRRVSPLNRVNLLTVSPYRATPGAAETASKDTLEGPRTTVPGASWLGESVGVCSSRSSPVGSQILLVDGYSSSRSPTQYNQE